ncbi:MAG: hypothetical protein ACXU82_15660 [Caulobacteraceae bacterium]
MLSLAIVLVALLALGPATVAGVRFAKRHRRTAFAATSLLLMLGVNFKVDPPPPPRIEAEEPDQEAVKDDEPK